MLNEKRSLLAKCVSPLSEKWNERKLKGKNKANGKQAFNSDAVEDLIFMSKVWFLMIWFLTGGPLALACKFNTDKYNRIYFYVTIFNSNAVKDSIFMW